MPTLAFCLSLLALLFAPGPTNALLALSGAETGAVRTLRLLPVVIAAYAITVMPLAALGDDLLRQQHMVRASVTFIAALWVAWMAVTLWRKPGDVAAAPDRGGRGLRLFITTLLNPKAFIIGLVLIPAQASRGTSLGAVLFGSRRGDTCLDDAWRSTAPAAHRKWPAAAPPHLRRLAGAARRDAGLRRALCLIALTSQALSLRRFAMAPMMVETAGSTRPAIEPPPRPPISGADRISVSIESAAMLRISSASAISGPGFTTAAIASASRGQRQVDEAEARRRPHRAPQRRQPSEQAHVDEDQAKPGEQQREADEGRALHGEGELGLQHEQFATHDEADVAGEVVEVHVSEIPNAR